MISPRRHAAAATLALTIMSLVTLPFAATAQEAMTVPVRTEAWYQPPVVGGADDPVCSLAGCPVTVPAPEAGRPENTLHVGAAQGQEESATFVAFDLSELAANATLVGGTAVLPVSGPEDGTVAAEAAEVVACLVTSAFVPAQGGNRAEAPTANCDISAPAELVEDADGALQLTIDLGVFLDAWATSPVDGIAVLPAPDAADTWHLAFSGTDREVDGAVPPISAVLQTASGDNQPEPTPSPAQTPTPAPTAAPSPSPAATAGPAPAPPVAPPPPPRAPIFSGPNLVAGPSIVVPPVAEQAPIVAADPAPTAPPTTPTAPAPVVAAAPIALQVDGYPYVAVWMLPLALLFLAMGLHRALSAEIPVNLQA